MLKSSDKNIPDEWLLFALNQASYIHRQNDEAAREIVGKAICELPSASKKQEHRPSAKTKESVRSGPERIPCLPRINLESMHLLQHLVFYHSEPYERAQELMAPDSLSEGDITIRYLAFIVRKVLKRNSLYGVTGVMRFIFNYDFKDVREIHDNLLNNPNCFKNPDVFRNNKRRFLDMVFERFQSYLRIEGNQNGQEKHFTRRENQDDPLLIRFVKKGMDSFKPWGINCLPAGSMPYDIFEQHDEHDVREIKRLHTLIHSDCFGNYSKATGIDAPDTRLGIPKFFSVKPLSGNSSSPFGSNGCSATSSGNCGDDGSGDDSSNASSQDQRLEVLRKRLAEHSERLERFVPEGVLEVKIDGKDVADFNLDSTNWVQFTVDNEEAERIEIVAESEPLVLAIHLLDCEVWESPQRECIYTVRHENGAKITFMFELVETTTNRSEAIEDVDTEKKLSVTVTYEETSLKRSLALRWRRLRKATSSWKPIKDLSPEIGWPIMDNRQPAMRFVRAKPKIYASPVVRKVVAATLLILISCGAYFFSTQKQRGPRSTDSLVQAGLGDAEGHINPAESRRHDDSQFESGIIESGIIMSAASVQPYGTYQDRFTLTHRRGGAIPRVEAGQILGVSFPNESDVCPRDFNGIRAKLTTLEEKVERDRASNESKLRASILLLRGRAEGLAQPTHAAPNESRWIKPAWKATDAGAGDWLNPDLVFQSLPFAQMIRTEKKVDTGGEEVLKP